MFYQTVLLYECVFKLLYIFIIIIISIARRAWHTIGLEKQFKQTREVHFLFIIVLRACCWSSPNRYSDFLPHLGWCSLVEEHWFVSAVRRSPSTCAKYFRNCIWQESWQNRLRVIFCNCLFDIWNSGGLQLLMNRLLVFIDCITVEALLATALVSDQL